MSGIDIFFLVVFAASALIGYIKGAVRQIGSIAGVVIGFIAARALGTKVGMALFMRNAVDAVTASSMSEPMARILGSVLVFLAAFVAVFVIARLLKGMISLVGLGFLDRLAGAVVSVVKWFLVVSMALNILLFCYPSMLLSPDGSTLVGGKAMQWVIELFPMLMGIAGFN